MIANVKQSREEYFSVTVRIVYHTRRMYFAVNAFGNCVDALTGDNANALIVRVSIRAQRWLYLERDLGYNYRCCCDDVEHDRIYEVIEHWAILSEGESSSSRMWLLCYNARV